MNTLDTIGAGDTFMGFFISERCIGKGPEESMRTATRASSIAVSRPGAMDSIPSISELVWHKVYFTPPVRCQPFHPAEKALELPTGQPAPSWLTPRRVIVILALLKFLRLWNVILLSFQKDLHVSGGNVLRWHSLSLHSSTRRMVSLSKAST